MHKLELEWSSKEGNSMQSQVNQRPVLRAAKVVEEEHRLPSRKRGRGESDSRPDAAEVPACKKAMVVPQQKEEFPRADESENGSKPLTRTWGLYARYNALLRECHFLRLYRQNGDANASGK